MLFHLSRVLPKPRYGRLSNALLACGVLAAAACTGSIAGGDADPSGGGAGSGGPGRGGSSSGGGKNGGAGNGSAGSGSTGNGSGGLSGGAGSDGVSTPAPPPETGGQLIDNQRIFDCKPTDDGATPQRLWRLTGSQYYNTVAVAISGRVNEKNTEPHNWFDFAVPFDSANPDRFSTFSYSGTVSGTELRRALDTAALVAENAVADNHSCFYSGAVGKDCIQNFGTLLFSRPLTDEETSRYVKLSQDAEALQKGDGGKAVVEAMLMSPYFLFRTEIGTKGPDGKMKLTPYEVAAALSYTLVDWPPDDTLWAAAKANQLSTPEQIEPHVKRLMGAPDKSIAVQRFFKEYFKYPNVSQVFKDGKPTGGWTADDVLHDTEALVQMVLKENGQKDFWKTLLTTNKGFYGSYTDFLYFPTPTDHKDRAPALGTFPANERAGILTQPSFLVAFSTNDANKPVQRGHFVSESLLCRPTPSLPIGMIPVIPDDANRTLREKLAQHSADPKCAACHKLMDPLGLAFEAYDSYGRFRTTEAGKPADGSGVLTDSGNQDGPFKTPVELANKLANSDVVEGCFVRHSFRYWMGRNEEEADSCTMAAALDAYRKGGGNYVAMVTRIFTSNSFVNRLAQ